MLEPSSSEEDEDYEDSSPWTTAKDNSLKPPTAHQNGGPRSGSPNVVDGTQAGAGAKTDTRSGFTGAFSSIMSHSYHCETFMIVLLLLGLAPPPPPSPARSLSPGRSWR